MPSGDEPGRADATALARVRRRRAAVAVGRKESLERVKMLPAACGSRGTCISFGPWLHRGWVRAGYLVARSLDPDGRTRAYWKSSLVGRYGDD